MIQLATFVALPRHQVVGGQQVVDDAVKKVVLRQRSVKIRDQHFRLLRRHPGTIGRRETGKGSRNRGINRGRGGNVRLILRGNHSGEHELWPVARVMAQTSRTDSPARCPPEPPNTPLFSPEWIVAGAWQTFMKAV